MFANLILPLPLQRLYTYSIPPELIASAAVGKRVMVQFGSKKFYSGIIRSIHNTAPTEYKTKDILVILDEIPIVNEAQFAFWDWICNYYMSTPGDVLKAALPAGLRIESETNISFNDAFDNVDSLSPREIELLSFIEKLKNTNADKLISESSLKDIPNILRSLVEKGAVFTEEKYAESFRTKTEIFCLINNDLRNKIAFNECFLKLERSKKQLQVFMRYLDFSRFLSEKGKELVRRKDLIVEDSDNAALNALVKKNILLVKTIEISRLENHAADVVGESVLNEFQQKAYDKILNAFSHTPVTLLHGITSSGKTEIYIHLIRDYIAKDKQVLYLLPEIALTTQIINRLKNVFGNKVGVFHSKFSDAERVEVWKNINKPNGYRVILGVRSSVFLPFRDLGLIIVDEEHENTYKQYDPAPRYHARDAAIYLASTIGAKVLLGTATPAVETYHNVMNKKYALVELNKRYKNIELPEIIIIDTLLARKRKQMHTHFSNVLLEKIKETIAANEQIILFQNRRGFSPFVECTSCGWIPRCINCDVSLTYHRFSNNLICHYCGHQVIMPHTCGACANPSITTRGFGTEKIEEDLSILIPGIRTSRMDLDTTKTRKAYEKIICDFEEHKVDVLIGTQMVTKGLDFGNVSLVGILNADNMLNFPDFRAHERSFQLITQVSGRAGRSKRQGTVIIQTSDPENNIIACVVNNDYQKMLDTQLYERRNFNYPPYFRLIRFTLKHKNYQTVERGASLFAEELKKYFGDLVLGPQQPYIGRVSNYFLFNILLKIKRDTPVNKGRTTITNVMNLILSRNDLKNLLINADVDPY